MATSEPTPAQQPDGGAEEWTLVSIPMVGNGRCQLCPRRAGNLFRVPTGLLLCGDCRTAWRDGYRAHAGTPIPPTSHREAVYRALGEWLDAMEVTAKAAQLSSPPSDPYRSAVFAGKLAHQRFAEAASQYRMARNAAAHKESADEERIG